MKTGSQSEESANHPQVNSMVQKEITCNTKKVIATKGLSPVISSARGSSNDNGAQQGR